MDDGDEDSRTLFVSQLTNQVTEEILYELFLQCGPLTKVSLPPGRNYAFVTFKHTCSVDYALSVLETTYLFNRKLILKRKLPANRPSYGEYPFEMMFRGGGNNSYGQFPNGSPYRNYHY